MWDDHARRARVLQSRLDARLAAFAEAAAEAAAPEYVAVDMTGGGHEALAASAVHSGAYSASRPSTSAASLADPLLPPSSAQQHTAQRHRELLVEFQREFFRIRTSMTHALDRRRLLGAVKADINAYRAAHASETEAYLAERGHLDNSHRMLDETLDQAYATRAEFRAQQSQLGSVTSRMAGVAAQIPGVDRLLTLISRRRRRDTLILGVVIGLCVVILLWTGTR